MYRSLFRYLAVKEDIFPCCWKGVSSTQCCNPFRSGRVQGQLFQHYTWCGYQHYWSEQLSLRIQGRYRDQSSAPNSLARKNPLSISFCFLRLCRNGHEQEFTPEPWKSLNPIILWGSPPQGLSEARRGSAVFTTMLIESAAGAPRRGRRGSSQIIMKNKQSVIHICLI